MTPIEQIEQLTAANTDLQAKLTDAEGKLVALSTNVERVKELEAAVATHGEAIAVKDGEIATLKTERDEMKARAEKAESAMALNKPEAFDHISDGVKPVGNQPVKDAKIFTRKQIASMTPAEYRENRDAIIKAMNEGQIK